MLQGLWVISRNSITMLIVRNIIRNIAGGRSQVTVDKDSFRDMSQSHRAQTTQGKAQGLVAPLASVSCRNSAGMFFDCFTLDGVQVFYRYNKDAKEGENAHEFYVSTEEANKRYEPYVSAAETIELDITSDVGGRVTGQAVAV